MQVNRKQVQQLKKELKSLFKIVNSGGELYPYEVSYALSRLTEALTEYKRLIANP